jgi:predicted Zn finger-like uncharacterized protein
MYTHCPTCNSVFKVTAHQLEIAEGLVRCGQCNAVFNGRDRIQFVSPEETLSQVESSATPYPTEKKSTPHDDWQNSETEHGGQQSIHPRLRYRHRAPPETPASQAPQAIAPHGGDIPSLIQKDLELQTEASRGRRWSTAGMGLGLTMMSLLLVGQYIYFHRNEHASNPTLATFLTTACKWLNCTLEPFRDIDQIDLINRNVYSHPNVSNALVITATLVNHAPLPQPYPLIQVSLTNLQGQTIAARRFQPNEYLNQPHNPDAMMQPGKPVHVSVEVADPGERTLAFEFEFY